MHACTIRHTSLTGLAPLARNKKLPNEFANKYLHRLGFNVAVYPLHSLKPDLETLTKLVAAHVDSICYENIDIKLGKELPGLGSDATVTRVAVNGRGGYCFITVGAFASLLCHLGFVVTLHTANCSVEPIRPEKWGDHVVAVVHFGSGACIQSYVADVGLGEGPRKPFRVAEHNWVENDSPFSLEYNSEQGYWRFENPTNAKGSLPGFVMDMSTSAVGVCEFEAFHKYYWSHPMSGFVSGPVTLHRILADGSGVLSLRGCVLRRSHPSLGDGNGYKILQVVHTREEWLGLVRELFFMPLTDLTEEERGRLWDIVQTEHIAWCAKKGQCTGESGQTRAAVF